MALWRIGLRRKANGYRRGPAAAAALRACRTRGGGAEVRHLVPGALERPVRGTEAEAAPGRASRIGAVAEAPTARCAGGRTRKARGCKTGARQDPEADPTSRAHAPP